MELVFWCTESITFCNTLYTVGDLGLYIAVHMWKIEKLFHFPVGVVDPKVSSRLKGVTALECGMP